MAGGRRQRPWARGGRRAPGPARAATPGVEREESGETQTRRHADGTKARRGRGQTLEAAGDRDDGEVRSVTRAGATETGPGGEAPRAARGTGAGARTVQELAVPGSPGRVPGPAGPSRTSRNPPTACAERNLHVC